MPEAMDAALRAAITKNRHIFLEISITSFVLGAIAMWCMVIICGSLLLGWDISTYTFSFAVYTLTCSVVFHMSEFLVAAACRPHDTHPKAFMIYHSKEYTVANLAALVEFALESWLVPDSWKFAHVSYAGACVFGALVVLFYSIRVTAMLQCSANFSLEIEETHREEHELVTRGLYTYLRHPSYFGWFYRTMFSQLILMNPVCFVGFTVVTWKFFASRIPAEEELLRSKEFFGEKYETFAKRTPIGIPFIE